MMRMRTKTTELTTVKGSEKELEVRPGGMLVQKRDPDDPQHRVPPPTIRIRVKHGSIYHEIIIASTATFGELKKKLTGPTGLHHEDQKIIYKDKERASKTFLDFVGVKDKSKMVVVEDPISREKRQIEARKNAKIEKAGKSMVEISLEVDRLAGQVSAVESVISKGGKVADKMVSDLIGLLMNQLIKLDEIKVDGDLNRQKKLQVEKVQRYVETLDVLKVKNTTGNKGNENYVPKQPPPQPQPTSKPRLNQSNARVGVAAQNRHQSNQSVGKFSPIAVAGQPQEASSKNTSGAVVVTTQWETFDSLPTVFSTPQMSTSTSTTSETIQHNFNWDLLLK
ncbi:putative Ubiquitin-like domain, BAG domain, Ubiquitin-like domain superfamily [Helianthus annuus]|nr:putative Ubiquitin-like domain, BAG domain, Ubiquitin-like domain superfamily [Helianthus annuus]